MNPFDASDASRDADGDGFTNLQEFLAGTNPNQGTSVLKITQVQLLGNDVHIRFEGVSGKRYRLERIDGMGKDGWTSVLEFKVGLGRNIDLIDSVSPEASSRVYRVRVLP